MATIANEVKQEMLDKVKSGQKVSEVSNQYGVSSRTIYLWLRKGVTDEISLAEYRRLKKENQELKAIVGTLIVQLEKTKKRTEIRLESQRLLDQQGQTVCLSRLSAWFGLSRSDNYYQLKQISKDEQLKEQILSVLESNPGYGHRRIVLALGLGKRRVRRVMKLFGIKAYKRKRSWRKRQDERRPGAGFPNLVKGICPIRPNLVWVTDFTYLRFKNSFIYLCTFMDLFTRQIVGWSLSVKHTKQLIINAFFDAFQNTDTTPTTLSILTKESSTPTKITSN